MCRNKRIAVLSYFLPPDPEVGGIRPHRIARDLAQDGHEVTVLCPENSDRRVSHETPHGYRVAPIRLHPGPRDLLLDLRWRVRRGKEKDSAASDPGSDPWGLKTVVPPRNPDPGELSTIKRFLLSLLWLPDDRQGFIAPAVRELKRLMVQGLDLVYSSGPPFSVHLAAYMACLGWRGRWLVEFRDPWVGVETKPGHVRSRFSDWMDTWLEGVVIGGADTVIGASDGISDAIRGRFPEKGRHILTIRNGIERLADSVPRRGPVRSIRIVHVGSLYHDRDPRPFLRGLKLACERVPESDIRVELVGRARGFQGVSLEEFVADLGLGGRVKFVDWIPNEECLDLIATADLLLVFAQNQPAQVPNKLYEYLGTRRPILAFADEAGETARMLRQVGGHFLVTDESPEATAKALEVLVRTGPPPTVDDGILEEWTTSTQMALLRAAIGG